MSAEHYFEKTIYLVVFIYFTCFSFISINSKWKSRWKTQYFIGFIFLCIIIFNFTQIAHHSPLQSLQVLPAWQKYCVVGCSIFVGITGFIYFAVLQEDTHRFRHNFQNETNSIPEHDAKMVVDCNNGLGECPLWDDRKGLLCWVDSKKKTFWTYNPKTKQSNSYDLPECAGSFCLCQDGSYLFAFEKGPAFWDPFNDKLSSFDPKNRIFDFEVNKSTRMNDGRVDKQGRFVVGGMLSMYYSERDYVVNVVWKYILNVFRALSGLRSAVYRINKDLTYTKLFDNVMLSNSICFGLDGTSMYFTDSVKWIIFERHPRIEVYEYDEDDTKKPDTNNGKLLTNKVRSPDGCIVDSNGSLWSAQVMNGKIVRYDLDGNVNMIVNVPSRHPTCCCFGGDDLNTLYITSLQATYISKWDCCSRDGALFAVKINDVKGNKEDRFQGSRAI
eukprot:18857_1